MHKILITGGSGFIGRHFQKHLPEDLITNIDLVEPKFPTQAKYIKGDIRQFNTIDKAIRTSSVNTIIALAAMHHDFGISEEEYFDTNEKGTKVLCDVASKNNIKTIVFYSSVAVYGENKGASSESTNPNPDLPYGASKLAGENILYKWAAADPSRKALIIRPALVFGNYNRANMYNLINQINRGIYFHIGKANNIKSIAYVNNIVDATLWALKRLKPGTTIYNYADEPQLTSRQIAEIIASALGKKIKITLPKRLGIILGLPFDLLIKITGKNFPVSSNRIKKLATETHHSASQIFNDGFKPKHTTKEGLIEMVKWYKEAKA